MPSPKPFNTINNPKLFTKHAVVRSIQSGDNSIWRGGKQPLWPTKSISFTPNDDYRRRYLIRALTSPLAPPHLQNIGYQVFMCSPEHRCNSPLCNYCRTKMQDRYQKRVLGYFDDVDEKDIYWLTILDDLTYDPIATVPDRRIYLKRKIKRVFDDTEILSNCKMFAAFELDVKHPSQFKEKEAAIKLLSQYGLMGEDSIAFMPHFHGLVAIDGASANQLRDAMRQKFTKPSQVSLSPLRADNTKDENLANLARYMFKFRYQFSDNIKREKSAIGGNFDDDTLRKYAEVIHQMIGTRGTRQLELKYNL